ncbi:MAG: hypothetical protein KDA54_15530 [Phycisphaerales bacterium]|nr:hypothetical protein [Phycisphaerales bacterium]
MKRVAKMTSKDRALRAARMLGWITLMGGGLLMCIGFWHVSIATSHLQLSFHPGSMMCHVSVEASKDWDWNLRISRDYVYRSGKFGVAWDNFSPSFPDLDMSNVVFGKLSSLWVNLPLLPLIIIGAGLVIWLPDEPSRRLRDYGRCLYCGYDLRYSESDRCSECGEIRESGD